MSPPPAEWGGWGQEGGQSSSLPAPKVSLLLMYGHPQGCAHRSTSLSHTLDSPGCLGPASCPLGGPGAETGEVAHASFLGAGLLEGEAGFWPHSKVSPTQEELIEQPPLPEGKGV